MFGKGFLLRDVSRDVVLDVFSNEAGQTILRVQTVRNIFRRLTPEFIEFDLAPEAIAPATMADLQAEIEQYREFLDEALVELVARTRRPQTEG